MAIAALKHPRLPYEKPGGRPVERVRSLLNARMAGGMVRLNPFLARLA
jgi:hypothetical protein